MTPVDPLDPDDPGPRLDLLARFHADSRPGFWNRLQRRIERRAVTSSAIEFGWTAVRSVFLEFITLIFNLPAALPRDTKRPR
jgi:hypothetical protein